MQSVDVDLSIIGMGIVSFSDVGINGDETVHDDIWTAKVTHPGINHGIQNVNVSISDGWSNTEVSTELIITNLAPRMTALELNPTTVSRGDTVDVSATVYDAHGVSTVVVDLTGFSCFSKSRRRFCQRNFMGFGLWSCWFGNSSC